MNGGSQSRLERPYANAPARFEPFRQERDLGFLLGGAFSLAAQLSEAVEIALRAETAAGDQTEGFGSENLIGAQARQLLTLDDHQLRRAIEVSLEAAHQGILEVG